MDELIPPLLYHDDIIKREPEIDTLRTAYQLIRTDVPLARDKLISLSKIGSIMAMLYLAESYGDTLDVKSAKYWYKNAYEAGSSLALLKLVFLIRRSGDYLQAETLLKAGVARGDAPSFYSLGQIYHNNPIFRDKRGDARNLLEQAANMGQLRAQALLARLLISGRYGVAEIPKGIRLFFSFVATAFKVAMNDPNDRRLW